MPTSSLSSYLVASAKSALTLFRQIMTLRGITLPMSYNVYGPFGEHLGKPKIATGVIMALGVSAGRTWGVKTPSGNPEGLSLLGEEGCPSPLLLWSSICRESGGNRGSVQRILGRERAYMEERASILPPCLSLSCSVSLSLSSRTLSLCLLLSRSVSCSLCLSLSLSLSVCLSV